MAFAPVMKTRSWGELDQFQARALEDEPLPTKKDKLEMFNSINCKQYDPEKDELPHIVRLNKNKLYSLTCISSPSIWIAINGNGEKGYLNSGIDKVERVANDEYKLWFDTLKIGDYIDIHRLNTDKHLWRVIKINDIKRDSIVGTLIGDKYPKKYRKTHYEFKPYIYYSSLPDTIYTIRSMTVFGYIRIKFNIFVPKEVISICCMYYGYYIEEFTKIGEHFLFDCSNKYMDAIQSVYLSQDCFAWASVLGTINIDSTQNHIYEWRIRLNSFDSWPPTIGIVSNTRCLGDFNGQSCSGYDSRLIYTYSWHGSNEYNQWKPGDIVIFQLCLFEDNKSYIRYSKYCRNEQHEIVHTLYENSIQRGKIYKYRMYISCTTTDKNISLLSFSVDNMT